MSVFLFLDEKHIAYCKHFIQCVIDFYVGVCEYNSVRVSLEFSPPPCNL